MVRFVSQLIERQQRQADEIQWGYYQNRKYRRRAKPEKTIRDLTNRRTAEEDNTALWALEAALR
ncbi:MAG TPA: hypothetical protein VN939_13825 [Chthoniobacterales bacterium]|jgi:hypothetical protein|nr:hypothetical protein [Chthoniobacterales bacterium]